MLFPTPRSLSSLQKRQSGINGPGTSCPGKSLLVICPPSSSWEIASDSIVCLGTEEGLMASPFPGPPYTSGRWCNASLMNIPQWQPFTVREGSLQRDRPALPPAPLISGTMVSFPSLCCWSTQGRFVFLEEALHGNLHLWPLLPWLCSCRDKSRLICKCFLWGIPKIALTFTDSTTQEHWFSTHSSPAAKARVHSVDVLRPYVEPRKTWGGFLQSRNRDT